MSIQRLLLGKLPLTSCGRTLVLERSTMLSCNVHVDCALIRLGVVTVRALKRTTSPLGANVFVRHTGGGTMEKGGWRVQLLVAD